VPPTAPGSGLNGIDGLRQSEKSGGFVLRFKEKGRFFEKWWGLRRRPKMHGADAPLN
jgi:hypothetical protein